MISFFFLFSFTWRSLKTNSWCFACYTSSFVRAQWPHIPPQQGSFFQRVLVPQDGKCLPSSGTARAVPIPHPGLQAEPWISSVPYPLCYHSCQFCSQNLFLTASTLMSFSLMVFLLFCLTCFCSSQQGLFVILMSTLCPCSSFPSHVHFSTWVERFRDTFCNSVLAFHCGPESVFLLLF